MADVHNEDMIIDLNSALSKVREALDTTVKIERDPSMSVSDRNSNVAIVKAAVTEGISTLQGCTIDDFTGTAAPDYQISTLRIESNSPINAGTSATFSASADYVNHKGVVTEEGLAEAVIWSSSDGAIVSINSSTGVATAEVPGNVTITARAGDGTLSSVPMIVI